MTNQLGHAPRWRRSVTTRIVTLIPSTVEFPGSSPQGLPDAREKFPDRQIKFPVREIMEFRNVASNPREELDFLSRTVGMSLPYGD
jgi:hypothetical protein